MLHRRRLLALAAVAGGAPSLASARQIMALPTVDPAAILAETGVPALAGLVSDADKVTQQVVAGVRRAGAADPAQTTDPWHIGSNTKAMTAALYARLVEAGKAKWGASLASLFPGAKLDPAWSDTTVERLMSHVSGISDKPLMAGGWLARAHADKRPLVEQRAELAAQLLSAPPSATPGKYEYANMNYVLVGAAIEAITGTPWEQAIDVQLFKPLGITSAGFGAPKGAIPWGHLSAPGGGLTPVDPAEPSDNPPAMGPAGTVHMTLADHARFARLFLKDNAILSADSVKRLTTPVGDAIYALGWLVVPTQPWSKGPLLVHEGSNTMWHEVIMLAPGRGAAIITASNVGPAASKGAANKLLHQLRAAYVS
ncbi:serine hydrolase domain-containing protein [Caulobacter endophyticus]|uniref:serine hydrolase domain-containing protein n=1 Tax=Caulobacter endophyticus TaxID=2172652 RepID=UPI0024108AF1|nr:serine hydrolase domain-containing protein [Caulobacter endophyticus]MDG2530734.1 serine hydrolase [Caulobacter endophyticus]